MGDKIGIQKHIKPTTDSLNQWINLADSGQTCHFALAYLKELGSEVIEEFGYSYKEIEKVFDNCNLNPSISDIPWNTAIRPSHDWSRKERLTVNRALAIQSEGNLKGNFSFLKENYRSILRSLVPN